MVILKNIYFAFVPPHILYSIEIYGNTSNVHLKKLISLNNKLLRILQNKPNKFPVKDLYAFANYFTSNSTLHQHDTREKENLHLTSVSKDFEKRSVKHKASELWNQLLLSLKDYCSVKQVGLPRPLCSRLRPGVRHRQTDRRQTSDRRQTKASLNTPPIRDGSIIITSC